MSGAEQVGQRSKSPSQRRPILTLAVFVVEVLRGPSFLIGSSMSVVAFALAVLVDLPTRGWGDALNFVLSSVVVLGPLSAGAAALCTSELLRRGVLGLAETAPHGRSRAVGLAMAALGFWQVLALVVTLIVATRRVDLTGAFDVRMLALPASALLLMAACLCFGAALGVGLPGRAASPVAVLATFVVLFFAALQSGRSAAVSPVFSGVAYQTFYAPNVRLIAGHLAVEIALAAGALAFLARRQARRRLAATGAVAVLVGAGLVSTSDPSPLVLRHVATGRCADSSGVTLCVWPEDRELLAPGLGALVAARRAAEPFVQVPQAFAQPGVASSQSDADGVRAPRRVEYTLPSTGPDDTLARAVRAVLPPPTCQNPGALGAWLDLVDLVEVRSGSSYEYPDSLRALAMSPLDAQKAWAAERLAEASSCAQ